MKQNCGTMVRSFLLSKPPMMVFIFCLFAFAFTTLSLSFYVTHSDKIPNPDILSWNSLLIRISKLEFCLQPPAANISVPNPAVNQTSDLDQTVSISVPISPKFLEEFRLSVGKHTGETVLARGEIAISKLGRHLSRYEGHTIFLTFEIFGDDLKNNNGDVCLFVEGPKMLLADLNSGNSPDNCSSDVLNRNATFLNLLSHSQDEAVAPGWCDAPRRNETPMVLEFVEQPDWSVYVSAKDKQMMQLHLLVIFCLSCKVSFHQSKF